VLDADVEKDCEMLELVPVEDPAMLKLELVDERIDDKLLETTAEFVPFLT